MNYTLLIPILIILIIIIVLFKKKKKSNELHFEVNDYINELKRKNSGIIYFDNPEIEGKILSKNPIPYWFKGTLKENGDTIEYNGKEFKLSALGLSIYNWWENAPDRNFYKHSERLYDFKDCIEWFKFQNPELYNEMMVAGYKGINIKVKRKRKKTVKAKKDKAPDWFNGTLYEKGDTIEYKGKEFKLSALELSIYDLLMGSYAMTESPASQSNPNYTSFMINQKNCIEWLRVENPELFEALTAIE